jgi:hypothetical protein
MREVVLLQNNARPHTAALTQLKLEQLGWKTLEHPPYSPDLSPFDFHVFGPLKEALEGERFNDDAGVEAYVRSWLLTHSTRMGFQSYLFAWKMYFESRGIISLQLNRENHLVTLIIPTACDLEGRDIRL